MNHIHVYAGALILNPLLLTTANILDSDKLAEPMLPGTQTSDQDPTTLAETLSKEEPMTTEEIIKGLKVAFTLLNFTSVTHPSYKVYSSTPYLM